MAEVTPLRRAATDRFSLAESQRRIFHHVAMAGTSLEDLAKPEYWSRIAREVQPLDRIECIDDEQQWFVELIVLSADPVHGLRLKALRGVELNGEVAPRGASSRNTSGVRAVYMGPHLKWCAVRGDDEVIKEKCASEAECNRFIAGYLKTQEK